MKEIIVLDFDDFQDHYSKNGLQFMFYWKAKYPKLKITLFTIPNKTSDNFLKLLEPLMGWVQLGIHGWNHDNNFEVQYWTKETANKILDTIESKGCYQKIFKSPGWQITYPQPYNSSPDPSKPVNSDPQLIYNVFKERGYIVADQHYNRDKRPEGLKTYCTCNSLMIHGHTWNMESGEPNGMEQIEKAGVPWNQDTEFKFLSQAWEEGLIVPC